MLIGRKSIVAIKYIILGKVVFSETEKENEGNYVS